MLVRCCQDNFEFRDIFDLTFVRGAFSDQGRRLIVANCRNSILPHPKDKGRQWWVYGDRRAAFGDYGISGGVLFLLYFSLGSYDWGARACG